MVVRHKSMPKTDEENDDGYYTDWGSDHYPGWMERRYNESWGMEWFYCKLCRKFMTDDHKAGDGHTRKLEWWLEEKKRRDGRGGEPPPQQGDGGGGNAPRDGGGGNAPPKA